MISGGKETTAPVRTDVCPAAASTVGANVYVKQPVISLEMKLVVSSGCFQSRLSSMVSQQLLYFACAARFQRLLSHILSFH